MACVTGPSVLPAKLITQVYAPPTSQDNARQSRIGMSVRLCAAAGEQGTPTFDSDAKAADDNNEAGGIVKAAKEFLAFMSSQNEEFTKQLKRFGIAGVLSYGLFNTVYYLGTFLFVWFYVSPSPGRLGYAAAAQRFMKVLAMVWAGSQVTKLFRAAGALALAPVVDRGLSWFTNKFHFQSREKAFGFVVGACFGLAVVVFLVITTLWA